MGGLRLGVMPKLLTAVVLGVVALALLSALVPVVTTLAHVLVPLLVVVTFCVVVLRVIWHLTDRL